MGLVLAGAQGPRSSALLQGLLDLWLATRCACTTSSAPTLVGPVHPSPAPLPLVLFAELLPGKFNDDLRPPFLACVGGPVLGWCNRGRSGKLCVALAAG